MNFMPFSLRFSGLLAAGCLLAARSALADSGYAPEAGEYAIAGSQPGDQVFSQLGLNAAGGYVVWQDNITDGDGWGISAQQLDGNFSGVFGTFRVNQQGAGDQEFPQVSLLNGGGAAFVWQGGKPGFPHIWARFLSAGSTWSTGDVAVNTFTNDIQMHPVIATLTNGNVIVAWASFNEAAAGSLQDVYGQVLSPVGQKIGGEFLVNQFTANNQRNPAVVALSDGGFVVAWVSEGERSSANAAPSVDVYARKFTAAGAAVGSEFLVNTGANICDSPSAAAASDGGFAVAWAEKDAASPDYNSWDVYARQFSSAAVGGAVLRVNTQLYGDQYAPKISYSAGKFLVVWTSLGQDGSREGAFGQFLNADGTPAGGEMQVNTTTASQQMQQAVAADNNGRFLVTWASFTGVASGFDMYAQRYAPLLQPLTAPDAPFVTILSSTNLTVSWPALAGYSVADYEVYADGATNAAGVTTNLWWTMNGLGIGSTHNFQLAYVLTDGRRSPISASAGGTTYLYPFTWGGIPYDWMIQYYGADTAQWPPASSPAVSGGPKLLYVFLSGGNPTNGATWLRTQLTPSSQGLFLSWNPQPGLIYQVQSSPDMKAWTNLGAPRFAEGTYDAIFVGGSGQGYYRLLRLR